MSEADKIMDAVEVYGAVKFMDRPPFDLDLPGAYFVLRETIESALLSAYAEGRKDERAEHFHGVDIDAVHRVLRKAP